jgi:hypothetical protein
VSSPLPSPSSGQAAKSAFWLLLRRYLPRCLPRLALSWSHSPVRLSVGHSSASEGLSLLPLPLGPSFGVFGVRQVGTAKVGTEQVQNRIVLRGVSGDIRLAPNRKRSKSFLRPASSLSNTVRGCARASKRMGSSLGTPKEPPQGEDEGEQEEVWSPEKRLSGVWREG